MITHRNIHENYRVVIVSASTEEMSQRMPKYDPQAGDLWLDTTTGKLKRYNGSTWVIVGDGELSRENILGLVDINDLLPDQTNHEGEYLQTDGQEASWQPVETLPSQEGNAGKVLTTDGSEVSWGSVLGIRNAFCAADAASGSTISCYLDADATGDPVTVTCQLFEASNLADCYPLLTDGQLMPVYYDGTNWRALWNFIGVTEECS